MDVVDRMDPLGNREQVTGDSRPRQQAIGNRPQKSSNWQSAISSQPRLGPKSKTFTTEDAEATGNRQQQWQQLAFSTQQSANAGAEEQNLYHGGRRGRGGKRQEATAQSREQGTGNREQQRTQTKSGLPGVNDRYSHGLKVAEVPGYNCHAME